MDLDLKKMTDPRAPHNRFYITKWKVRLATA
jgi:hypothetical protein